jgi:hypothetical protein
MAAALKTFILALPTLANDPLVESLEQINLEISNYKAELGRSGGGYVQIRTKSGTNELHGLLYEFLRNDKFDARNFFAASKPVLRYNQFGASLRGPIRKDKTFLFANYEGLLIRRQQTVIAGVPTVAEMSFCYMSRHLFLYVAWRHAAPDPDISNLVDLAESLTLILGRLNRQHQI